MKNKAEAEKCIQDWDCRDCGHNEQCELGRRCPEYYRNVAMLMNRWAEEDKESHD